MPPTRVGIPPRRGRLKERGIYIKKIDFRRGVYWRGVFERERAFIGENTVSICVFISAKTTIPNESNLLKEIPIHNLLYDLLRLLVRMCTMVKRRAPYETFFKS